MKRLATFALMLVAAVGVVTAPAVAATGAKKHSAPIYKSDAFTCAAGAADTSGQVYGKFSAKLKSKGSVVEAKVKLRHADANATYDIYLNQDPGGCPTTAIAHLKTNKRGDGEIRLRVGHVSGATVAWVSAVDATQTLRSTAVKLTK